MKPRTITRGHGKGCPCNPCVTVRSRYYKWHELATYRNGPRLIPSDNARNYVNYWLGRDWSATHLAHLAACDRDTVWCIARGDFQKISRDLDAALQGVIPHASNAPDPERSLVPRVGAVRRIRALYWLGHTSNDIDAELTAITDISRWMCQPGTVCVANSWLDIDRVYNQLSLTRGRSKRTAGRAARAGYASPLAWDDIDDPDETPKGVAA